MKTWIIMKQALAVSWLWLVATGKRLAQWWPVVKKLMDDLMGFHVEPPEGECPYRPRPSADGTSERMPHYQEQTEKLIRSLEESYLLRRNRLTGCIEYKRRDDQDKPWRTLSREVMNAMTIDALLDGIEVWDKDMRRYMESTYVPEYDPIALWLQSLPAWDGTDRIRPLARRIPTADRHWADDFHRWFLGMVAQWQGSDMLHGHAMVPLLIGAQGDGKSTFCRLLLPPELHEYYTDRIDFTNRNDAVKMLTRFALINLDEYDQLTRRQNAFLKHILQKSDVKVRRMWRETVEQRQRYASFIGTTNDPTPLSDPTGSRRYLCVQTNGTIDTCQPFDYQQLYAQAVEEIEQGERTWFSREEEQRIQHQNEDFQLVDDIEQVFFDLFHKPRKWEPEQWLSPTEILHAMHEKCIGVAENPRNLHRLGKLLKQRGFERRRAHAHVAYKVAK